LPLCRITAGLNTPAASKLLASGTNTGWDETRFQAPKGGSGRDCAANSDRTAAALKQARFAALIRRRGWLPTRFWILPLGTVPQSDSLCDTGDFDWLSRVIEGTLRALICYQGRSDPDLCDRETRQRLKSRSGTSAVYFSTTPVALKIAQQTSGPDPADKDPRNLSRSQSSVTA
jgi:hypothetical protein